MAVGIPFGDFIGTILKPIPLLPAIRLDMWRFWPWHIINEVEV